jgi:fumarate hydratase, class II
MGVRAIEQRNQGVTTRTDRRRSDALAMVAAQVMGNHVTATLVRAQATSSATYSRVNIQNVLQSCRILADSAISFASHMVDNPAPNRDMLVTSLNPLIGYEQGDGDRQARACGEQNIETGGGTSGLRPAEDFDRWFVLATMTMPGSTLPGGGG